MKKSIKNQVNKIKYPEINKELDSTKQDTPCTAFSIKLKETSFDDLDSTTKDIQQSDNIDKFQIKLMPIKEVTQSFQIRIPYYIDQTNENEVEKLEESEHAQEENILPFHQFLQKEQTNIVTSWKMFVQFTKSRFKNQEKEGKINLQVCDFKEVIQFCLRKQIISKDIFKRFELNYNAMTQKNFITFQKNRFENEYERFLFKKSLFALIDHRFFCKILMLNFPQEFEMKGKPLGFNTQTTNYLNYIYNSSYNAYEEYCEELNKKYNRFWMPKKGVDLKNFKLNIFVEPDEEDLFEYMIHMKRSLRKRGAAIQY